MCLTWKSFEHKHVGNIYFLHIFQIQECKARRFFYLRLYSKYVWLIHEIFSPIYFLQFSNLFFKVERAEFEYFGGSDVANMLIVYDFLNRFKGSWQLCPSPGSAADSCPPWPYNAPGSIAYRWHSYIIDSYSIWMLATCPYGGGWLWQTWNGATALCMQENGGKNNVLLKLYHVLLLLF